MWKGQNGQEDKIRSDPFLKIRGMKAKETRQGGQSDKSGYSQRHGEKKESAQGAEPGFGL
jgi:hypothetical protein